MLRIRGNVYPGSRVRLFSIPHPGSRIPDPHQNPKEWFQSSRKYDPGCSSRIRILTFYPFRIQRSKRKPDPRSTTLNIRRKQTFSCWHLKKYYKKEQDPEPDPVPDAFSNVQIQGSECRSGPTSRHKIPHTDPWIPIFIKML